ncbi:MAG: hypothetical protein KBE16_08260, partial [Alphaproteobacteria bacterium]|nr:hypothetical protein [Alphaproteobacteria bacterium]
AAENNFVPVLVAGAVIAMQIATVVDVATNCYEFKVAMDKGDVNGAIAAGVAIGMAAVPGQKLIPAPLRNAVHGVVTKSVTRILHSKYGQAAVKAGGELVDAASGKVQNLANKAANSKAGQAFSNSSFGKGLQNAGDRLVQHVEGTTAQQAEKGIGKDIDLRVKPKAQTTAPAADKNYFDGNSKIKQLDRKGFVEIDGIQIRGARDLSHMSDSDVWKMYKKGNNPVDVNGDTIIYHHFEQQYHRAEGAFMSQMPSQNHSIWNPIQHPFGNTKDAGLSALQRKEWNNIDRPMINKTLGKNELIKRGLINE